MFAHRFWGGCKHVHTIKKTITMEIADHEVRYKLVQTPDDLLPVGHPIRGNGWECTLLTRSRDGVVYLGVQGVVHHVPQKSVWDEISERGFEVSDECVWIDIAHYMGSEVAA